MSDTASIRSGTRAFDRARIESVSEWLACGVAVALPWSTTAAEILIYVWLATRLLTLDPGALRQELSTAAGGLPVLLFLLAATGMLWAQVSWPERLSGLTGFLKLLFIPLLLMQFRRSQRGHIVLYGFLASCLVLLAVSWLLKFADMLGVRLMPGKQLGMPARDYIAQSAEFFLCAFALLGIAVERWRAGLGAAAAAGIALLAVLFLANVYVVATGRTALVVIPVLLLMFGFRYYGWKGVAGAVAAAILVFAIAWPVSSFLRQRINQTIDDVQSYHADNSATFTGMRIEFLKNAARFVAEAPVIGHGTGSMPDLYRRAAEGQSGAAAVASVNPHNQFFAVSIQLGLVGGAILIAMWIAHLGLFRVADLVAWMGLVVVTQNIISSLFNSHLFDFLHGWLYVFGLGVLGGMALRRKASAER
jgi:O-antigen ligase